MVTLCCCVPDGHKLWKNMFFLGAIPVIILGHVNAFLLTDPNAEHRPEFVPYEYLRIRTKVPPPSNNTYIVVHYYIFLQTGILPT